MKIALLVEGRTEKAFLHFLRAHLSTRLPANVKMPGIHVYPYDGRIPKAHKLRHDVRLHLKDHDAVVALTDVYTGTREFADAKDARLKMAEWVGPEFAGRFFPHAAQHDFEAWLLPFWGRIQELSGHKGKAPGKKPEQVNHDKPPSWHVGEAFRRGGKRTYSKTRDAAKILEGQDLGVVAAQCPEFEALVGTLVELATRGV